MGKNAVKKLLFLIRHVPDQYKTQDMCNKDILENEGTLKTVPQCYKNYKMCNKVVNNCAHALNLYLIALKIKN